jgi:hypothetical protein
MFDASYSQLEQLAIQWQDGKLTSTESYLLYLALFNKTGLVQFRTNAVMTDLTDSIVAQSLPALFNIVDTILYAGSERAKTKYLMPTYVISSNTNDLSNTKYWINNWVSCHKEYLSGYKSSSIRDKLEQKESVLEVYIKDKSKDVSQYAMQLASWAELAGDFKSLERIVCDASNNDRPISLTVYWKRIICQCAKKQDVFTIDDEELDYLIEYFETCIDVVAAGIFGHTLLSVLRSAQATKKALFDLGDIDVGVRGTVYKVLDDAEVEDSNKIVLINSAPLYEPRPNEYPSRLHYLRAKTKWDMAQRYKLSDSIRADIENELIDSLVPTTASIATTTPVTPINESDI